MTQKTEKKRAPPRPFPKHTIAEALAVAEAIQNKNAGKPWKPIFVAEALNISPTSTNFRDLTSSAFKYGLTQGTWNAQYISLSQLGNSITKPIDPIKRVADLQKAVQNVEIFKSIYEHYRDSKFPSEEDAYFKNMLEVEFHVPREFVDECARMLMDNGKFSGIIRDVKGTPFVVFAETPVEIPVEAPTEAIGEPRLPPPEAMPPPKPAAPIVNQIFIGHGKNKTPLEQLKKILTEFKVPFTVAVDEPHKGRPISKKVADLMKNCMSAIFIFTADEEYTDAEGNKTYRPSDNVVYELGAASVLYENKIVIFKEDGVTFASDFSDLGYIPFEKDRIEAKAMDLLKELVGLGFLKITPA